MTTSRQAPARKPKQPKFAVKHEGYSGGPEFTSITEALAYVRHVLASGGNNGRSLTVIPLSGGR